MTPPADHFDQKPKRKAEFITPPNTLKALVGSGGLSDDILDKAQALIEHNTIDFGPLAELYLQSLMAGIETAKNPAPGEDKEYIIATMLYPAVQLKANGGMFHYTLITDISDKLIQFLEVVDEADMEAVEIVLAFHATIRAVVAGKISGDGGQHGKALMAALEKACVRYFNKYPDNFVDHNDDA